MIFKKKEEVLEDLPMIIIKDKETEKTIISWFNGADYKTGNKIRNINDLNKKIGLLLKNIGVESNEICEIEKIDDRTNLTYNCLLTNKGENYTITLKSPNLCDDYFEIIVSHNNIKREFFYSSKENDINLTLKRFYVHDKNEATKLSIMYSFNDKDYRAVCINGDKTINIDIKYNKTYNTYNCLNLESLANFLYNIELPIKIEDIYKEIEKSILVDMTNIDNIKIELLHKDKKGEEIIEFLELENGELKNLALTRNGRFVILNKNKQTGFESKKLEEAYISKKYKDKTSSFELILEPRWPLGYDEMKPERVYTERTEINHTKQLVKTLFKK